MKSYIFILFGLFSSSLYSAEKNELTETDTTHVSVRKVSELSLQGFGETGTLVKFGDYAPLYQVNNQHGLYSPTESSLYARAAFDFSYRYKLLKVEAGADVLADAIKYTPFHRNHVRLHQLYANIGVGKAELEFGMREHDPDFVNPDLSSGNMVWSENSRPIPMLRIGTKGFANICKWLSFKIDVAYGKMLDGKYRQAEYEAFMEHYNNVSPYHNSPLAKDMYVHRKSFFLRSWVDAPVVVTIGAEHAAMFGGTVNGQKMNAGLKSIINSTFFRNGHGGEENTQMAALDFRVDVNLKKFSIGAYTQLFMDNTSRSFKRDNGMDGLWGIEYTSKKKSVVSNIVFEYLQTSNQSGPVYTAYEDYKYGTLKEHYSISHYYNDQMWGPWSNYGLSNGSPMLASSIYNKDNAPLFRSTLVRAFHLGARGYFCDSWSYRLKAGLINSWGEPFALFSKRRTNFSMLAEFQYDFKYDITFKASAAFDAGKLYGNNGGFMLTVRKSLKYRK